MTALKWIVYVVLSILGLSVVLGAGAFVIGTILVLTVVSAGVFGVCFVAFCIKEWWESRSEPEQ